MGFVTHRGSAHAALILPSCQKRTSPVFRSHHNRRNLTHKRFPCPLPPRNHAQPDPIALDTSSLLASSSHPLSTTAETFASSSLILPGVFLLTLLAINTNNTLNSPITVLSKLWDSLNATIPTHDGTQDASSAANDDTRDQNTDTETSTATTTAIPTTVDEIWQAAWSVFDTTTTMQSKVDDDDDDTSIDYTLVGRPLLFLQVRV